VVTNDVDRVYALRNGASPVDILRKLQIGLARTAATLELQAREAEGRGRDSYSVRSRQLKIFKLLTRLTLDLHRLMSASGAG